MRSALGADGASAPRGLAVMTNGEPAGVIAGMREDWPRRRP